MELQLPLFGAESTWRPDTSFPEPPTGSFVALDTETRDPNLRDQGPGFIRGDAKVAGFSVGFENGWGTYLPIAHGDGEDLDPAQVKGWVQSIVKRTDIKLTGANLLYDIEACWSEGIEVKSPLYDVQVAEPLIDEERPGGYSLEELGLSYTQRGKNTRMLDEMLIAHGLWKKSSGHTVPNRGMIGHLPSKYVGAYAEEDCHLPIKIIQKQLVELQREELMSIFALEQELQPIMWAMRLKGVRVDVDAARAMIPDLIKDENELYAKMKADTGLNVDPDSGKSLSIAFEKLGLPIKLTAKGNPSFTADYLEEMAAVSPFVEDVLTYRKLVKMRRDFIHGMVVEKPVDGRLHPNWHQLRGPTEQADEGEVNGTRSGRIASTKVNLTQIPSRHPKWGKLIRSLFIADEGAEWCKCDYEQQEPRLQLEYAVRKNLPGASEALQRYIDNPATDYHQMVADLCTLRSGKLVSRRHAKTINLGLAYGMGFYKLARMLGMSDDDARALFNVYHEGVPYVAKLSEMAEDQAKTLGFVRTILGRRRHFKDWEPISRRYKDRVAPRRDYKEAVESWKYVTRAMTRKAWNSIVQGSAADQTKTAIINLHRLGLTPQIQVYDELNTSIFHREEALIMKREMENALPNMRVPFLVTPEVGRSWGQVEKMAA